MKTCTINMTKSAALVALLAIKSVDARCFFSNQSRDEGETLKGPLFTCTCGPNGNWVDCNRDGGGTSGTNTEERPYRPNSNKSIEGIVFNNEDFSTLFTALGAAELYGVLDGEGPFTVFAPTDEAFKKLPDGVLDYLLDNPDTLGEVLKYHVIGDAKILSTKLKANQKVATLEGQDVNVKKGCIKEETKTIRNSCGGWAPCFGGAGTRTKTTCVQQGVKIDDNAVVTSADVNANNGVVHIIDSVLVPPDLREAVEQIAADAKTSNNDKVDVSNNSSGGATIEDVVLSSDQFSTLATAVDVADLVGVLDGEGPFTVFAPNDQAFDKVPEKLLNFLLDNPETLAKVLQYHVVAGAKVMAENLTDGQEVETFLGDEVVVEKSCFDAGCTKFSIGLDDGANGSFVIAADIVVSNGVIHVIDEVIVPPSLQGAVNDLLETSK